ncbi:MAG: hypothetical protein MK119_16825 [Kordia sp.]|nr:hypothetical protein [Kordia sp.]
MTNKFLKDFVFQKNFKKIDWEQQGNRFILNESSYYIIHCAEDFPISEKVINTAIRRNKDFNNLILTTNKNVSNEVLDIIKREKKIQILICESSDNDHNLETKLKEHFEII